jgi:MYND finger
MISATQMVGAVTMEANAAAKQCAYERCQYHRNKEEEDEDNRVAKLKRCSRCRTRWYCSLTCQKADFPKHRKECRPWEKVDDNNDNSKGDTKSAAHDNQYIVEEREGKGKCLVATCVIHPKERIRGCRDNKEGCWDPLIPPVLNDDRRGTCCALCFHDLSSSATIYESEVRPPNLLYRLRFCSYVCRNEATRLGYYDEELAISRLCQNPLHHIPPRIFSTAILLYRIVLRLHNHNVKQQLEELQSKPTMQNSEAKDIASSPFLDAPDDSMAQYHTQAVIALS